MAGALNLGEQGEMTAASGDMRKGVHLPPTTH
jgi:hypothetical protein